ncbi:hypothetical protein [Paenibacillus sp. HJGM_3]|uniref:hypothetical protein n=1 Tax=Paenibacillus sp. HJGM_3 TaxID=3379816 RepID=UPI00385D5B61
MYTGLAIFGSLIGLFVTGAALFTAWSFYMERKAKQAPPESDSSDDAAAAAKTGSLTPLLKGWMVWDYAVILLFGVGAVFLFTDLLAVARDREQFPPYHYGYLLCGFIFCLLGMLFSFIRIATLIRLHRGSRTARMDHADEPEHAYHAEQRV